MSRFRRTNVTVGFDGGGTKTDCAVLNGEGKILCSATAGPSNPLRVGFDAAAKELAVAAANALAGAQLKPRDVDAVCAGLAGAGRRGVVRRTIAFLAREFPDALVHVTTDCEIALEAAVGFGPGVVLVAGTGSSAFGRNHAGETARAGGFGPWIGDEGSAYEIGRRALAWVLQARDQAQAGSGSVLAEVILPGLECPSWDDLIERVAKNPDEIFPRIFPLVVKAAGAEDGAACEILSSSALGLANMALTVVRRLGMQDAEFPLVKCGGVFGASAMLESMLESVVVAAAPGARVARLAVPAAVGAAQLAARLSAAELSPVHQASDS